MAHPCSVPESDMLLAYDNYDLLTIMTLRTTAAAFMPSSQDAKPTAVIQNELVRALHIFRLAQDLTSIGLSLAF